jgi:NAD(P)-dependent dehydrogenase (short-subunit alcohol dehydrogenase family)
MDPRKPADSPLRVFFALPAPLAPVATSPATIGQDSEVANLVAYLASPLSVATNGTTLRVEGGLLRSIA